MAILITGGTGFIGSHTCVELISAGKEIVIIDNLSNSKADVVDKIEEITGVRPPFYKVELLCEPEIEAVFEKHKIESVIHFAGLKAVGESVEKPLLYYHNNITGTLNLCRVMERHGVKKIVFSSSATVYGIPESVPLKEDAKLGPTTNPYGTTKLMIENILTDIAASDSQWHIILLRYFNPIGAHESGLIGENPNGIPNNLMPYITQVAIGKLKCLGVYGDDYPTHDGTGVRDYIHVVDLALGHLCAINEIDRIEGAEAFNLGTGTGYSVLDIVRAFEQTSGVPVPYEIKPRRAGDIAVNYADPSKALEILGWKATRDVSKMCLDSWNFIQKNG